MLNKTTITAIRALIYISLADNKAPMTPAQIAKEVDASPAYLSKIHSLLAREGILQVHRGIKGGVTLGRTPENIKLLHIVEACQGRILGDYCQMHDDMSAVCAFHVAMQELQQAMVSVLEQWTLADFIKNPRPSEALQPFVNCKMDLQSIFVNNTAPTDKT